MPAAVSVILTTRDGLRLSGSYYSSGAEPVAYVLAHGFTGSASTPSMLAISRQLSSRSEASSAAAVLAVNARGHAGSEGLCTLGAAEIYDIAAAVAFLRERHATVVVVGFSMGATTVLRYAGLGGDADAVIAVSGPAYWWERSTRPMRLLEWTVSTPTGRRLARLTKGVRISPGWRREPEQPVDVVAGIAVPLLIVHGDRDHYFPVRHPYALAAAAPTATLWIEAGMAHAEDAATPELIERMSAWARAATAAPASSGVRELS